MYKLLIAEDEEIERRAIQYFIEQSDLQFELIEEAEDGIEAVEKALRLLPDIIIMDIKMPGKDGLTAAKEIREINENCKIIFLTAFHEFNYARKAIKLKAEDYIIKPAYSEELLEVLNKVTLSLNRQSFDQGGVSESIKDCAQEEKSPSAVLVERVCRYIDQNYNKNIKLDEMCEMAGFSKYYFSRIFKQYKNINLVDYLTQKRLEMAKELLENPKLSVKEISAATGFSDANYLTAVFKKWEHISPTEYRSRHCR